MILGISETSGNLLRMNNMKKKEKKNNTIELKEKRKKVEEFRENRLLAAASGLRSDRQTRTYPTPSRES